MAESQGVNKRLLKTVQAGETLVFPPLILLILILSQCQTKKSSWQTTDSHDEESSEIFKGKTLKTAIIIEKFAYFLVCAENSLIIFSSPLPSARQIIYLMRMLGVNVKQKRRAR